MHNGRPHLNEFKLDVDGFRFVHHDTKVQNFFDEAESSASTIRRWRR